MSVTMFRHPVPKAEPYTSRNQTFTFLTTDLPTTLSASTLTNPRTHVKIGYEPKGIFVDAVVSRPTNTNDGNASSSSDTEDEQEEQQKWTVCPEYVPLHADCKRGEACGLKAMLYVTKGEFGKVLGSVDLGWAHLE